MPEIEYVYSTGSSNQKQSSDNYTDIFQLPVCMYTAKIQLCRIKKEPHSITNNQHCKKLS